MRLVLPALLVCAALPADSPKRLLVGYAHLPPISYRAPQGEAAGFAVEVFREAARREGIELVWRKVGGSDDIERALASGDIDLLAAAMDTPHRREVFFVSKPWWFSEMSVLTRAGGGIRRTSDLAGKRLALGSPAYRFLAGQAVPGSVLVLPREGARLGAEAAMNEACSGEVDAALITHVDVHEQMLSHPGQCRGIELRALETDALARLSVIARRDRQDSAAALRNRIDELTADGTLVAIAKRHPQISAQSAVLLAEEMRSRYDRNVLRAWLISALGALAVAGFLLLWVSRTQRALQRSEARYRGFFELAAVGTAQIDAATRRFIDVNEEFCRIVGYPRRVLLSGMTAGQLTHPDDRAADAAAFERFRSGQVSSYSHEKRYLRKDGKPVWVRIEVAGIRTAGGTVLYSLGIVQDITARRQAEAALRESEQRYRLLAEANPIGVVFAGIAGRDRGRVLNANEAFLALVGHSREELQAGQVSWSDLTPPEWRAADEQAIAQARSSGVSRTYEKQYIRKDGTRADVIVGCAALGANREHAVAFVLDVTERKRFEAQLRETQKLESIGVLAAGIAHDYNNLLGAVIGNASLALEEVGRGSAATRYVERAQAAAERAADLTRQLLAYAGGGTFTEEPVLVSQMAAEAVAMVRGSQPARIEFSEEYGEGVPPVLMDPGQCRQMILNLVMNGAEAIGETAMGRVIIRTYCEEAAVILEVADTGCGMDAATRERMFDPFFTTKFLGRGLGLAAVHGIVRSLQGAIEVDTAPGRGTRVRVRLPAALQPCRSETEAVA